MKQVVKTFAAAFSLMCLLVLNSCGCDEEEPLPAFDQIQISSSNGKKLDLEEVTVLTATGVDQYGDPISLDDEPVWSVNNANVSLDPDGTVTAIAVGKSVITVSSGEEEASITITVWDSSAPRIEIYVSDVADYFNLGDPKIFKYDENGKNPEVFIDQNLSAPQDILFLEDQGVVLISNASSGRITKHNAASGSYIGNFASGINFPTRMKIGPDGLLYVLQWKGELVLRFELDGTALGPFTSVGVKESIGLDWDSGGNLYVCSFNEGSTGFVRKFDTSGNDMGLFIDSNLAGPTNIWFDADGNLLVNDWQSGFLRKFSSSGAFISNLVAGITQVEGVDFLDNGHILLGVGSESSVKQYSSTGTLVKDLVPSQSGGLIKPNAVRVRRVNY